MRRFGGSSAGIVILLLGFGFDAIAICFFVGVFDSENKKYKQSRATVTALSFIDSTKKSQSVTVSFTPEGATTPVTGSFKFYPKGLDCPNCPPYHYVCSAKWAVWAN
jgi:hypothetical protein